MSSDERTGKTAYANVGTGHCDMAATAGGAKLYIVGTSGTIVARAFGGDEEKQWEAGDDELKAAAASPDGKRLVVGDDDCFVKEYALPTGEFLRNVTKLTLPIAHVDASASVIAMAADGEAKIFVEKGGDPTDMMTLSGHANGVKSLAIDPKEEFLASSSCDGTMRVWALGSGKQVHCEDAACAKDGENSQALHRLAWRPDGQQLALPGARQVKVLARGSWAPAFTLSGGSAGGGGAAVGHSSEVLAVAWSANGACLASADKEKRVVVWDVASRDVMTSFTVGDVPTALAWGGAGGRALCVLDRRGKLTTFADAAPDDGVPAAAATEAPEAAAAPKAAAAAQDSDSDDDVAGSGATRKRLRKPKRVSALDASDDESADEGLDEAAAEGNIAALKTALTPTAAAAGAAADGAAAAAAAAPGAGAGAASAASAIASAAAADGPMDSRAEKLAAALAAQAMAENGGKPVVDDDADADADDGFDDAAGGGGGYGTALGYPMQKPFAPSSSYDPDRSPQPKRKFLVWNTVGAVVTRDEGTSNSIEIDFADGRRAVRFSDHYNFTLCALAAKGAIFASAEVTPEDVTERPQPSTIYYRPFDSSFANASWEVTCPLGEEVLAVATGQQFAAAATTAQSLRLFHFSGTQHAVHRLPGPVVAMTATAGGPLLAVVYHGGSCWPDRQSLRYLVLNVKDGREVATGTLDLLPDVTLDWIAFSDQHMLCAMGSDGLLMGLAPVCGWRWCPLLDLGRVQKSEFESFWPIAVQSGSLMCVKLHGGSTYPLTQPRPHPTMLPLQLPLLDAKSKFGKLEDAYVKQGIAAALVRLDVESPGMIGIVDADDEQEQQHALVKAEAALDRALLKMIQASCERGNPSRALDLAMRLTLEKSHEIAAKLATAGEMPELHEKLMMLAQAKFCEESEEEEEAEEAEEDGAEEQEQQQEEEERQRAQRRAEQRRRRAEEREQEAQGEEGEDVEDPSQAAAAPSTTTWLGGKRTAAAPAGEGERADAASPPKKQRRADNGVGPVNPFAKKTMASPAKRPTGNVGSTLSAMHASPAKLNRNTSFSNEARMKQRRQSQHM